MWEHYALRNVTKTGQVIVLIRNATKKSQIGFGKYHWWLVTPLLGSRFVFVATIIFAREQTRALENVLAILLFVDLKLCARALYINLVMPFIVAVVGCVVVQTVDINQLHVLLSNRMNN